MSADSPGHYPLTYTKDEEKKTEKVDVLDILNVLTTSLVNIPRRAPAFPIRTENVVIRDVDRGCNNQSPGWVVLSGATTRYMP